MSTTTTSLPRSARQAAVVSPTYPAPMTATLLTPGGLSQYGFVGRDRPLSRLAPAERLRPLEAGTPPAVRFGAKGSGGPAERLGVPVLHEHAGVVDHLGQARVAVGRHRAAAGHRLEAGQAEALVPAGEHQAPGGRVEVGELVAADPAGEQGAGHRIGPLAAWVPCDDEPELGPDRARGRSRPQQPRRVLARIQGADKQEVARLQAPALPHPFRRAGLPPHGGVSRLRYDPDPPRIH